MPQLPSLLPLASFYPPSHAQGRVPLRSSLSLQEAMRQFGYGNMQLGCMCVWTVLARIATCHGCVSYGLA